jgi:hypothetical protein
MSHRVLNPEQFMLPHPNEDGPAYREHDYNPEWDYEIAPEHMGHPLAVQAQRRMNFLASLPDTQFVRGHVVPAKLGNAVGTYIHGTNAEPVALVDISQHDSLDVLDPEAEIDRTVDHEVRHAEEDANLQEPDEHHAEHGKPFPKGYVP